MTFKAPLIDVFQNEHINAIGQIEATSFLLAIRQLFSVRCPIKTTKPTAT